MTKHRVEMRRWKDGRFEFTCTNPGCSWSICSQPGDNESLREAHRAVHEHEREYGDAA
jgi:hypothetical protein